MTETYDQWKARQFVQNKRASLLEKIRLASKLGFTSDVLHWKSELNKFDEIVEEGSN
ncbi:hypothetical protein SEA_SLOOPYJOE_47 [Arthrobacter phage Sloopyjoe]|nr:hypothetical protein PBI_STAYER_47 [Arthrobacter phage Stayer]QFG09755.1 hypothetical protein PBI_SHIBA_46 [Arthrobacter phage Shiba]QFG10191.1 hypothetical protein PBI_EGAD_47 [Arthrobacter phage Egad]QFG11761.1 hypothetical protein PBI_SALK_47 [Arthrobacter phage Salk]QFG12644.1 hypothetical protein PBI_MICHELLE_47 [Arthrobacter phage Michelle]QFG14417.1 hypothetical protein PBI_STARLORD_47 [Arthrobacter phage StarLord]UVT31125.1 hypothetical protein PBI_LINDA_47 [Arthrobacter phage Lind